MRIHTVDYAVARCPFIRLFVTRRYYVEMAKHINKPVHLRVATSFWFFRTKPYGIIPTEISLTGRRMQAIFDQYLALSRKRYEIGPIVTMERQ